MKAWTERNGWKTLIGIAVFVIVETLHQFGVIDDAMTLTIEKYAGALGLYGLRRAMSVSK